MLGNYQLGQVTEQDLISAAEKLDVQLEAEAAQRRAIAEKEAAEDVAFVRKNIWPGVAVAGIGLLAFWAYGKWKER